MPFAWLVLLVAVIHPPHGLGADVCLFHAATAAPCPGCGLTRSVSCAARGMLAESWAYHPFGAPLLAAAVLVAGASLRPRVRAAASRLRRRHQTAMHLGYAAFVVAFVTFGAWRAVLDLTR